MTDDRSFVQRIEDRKKAAGTMPTAPPIAVNGYHPEPDHPLVQAALHERIADLSTMGKDSGRIVALHKAAIYLGVLPISRDTLRQQLFAAAAANGILDEEGHHECERNIRNGFAYADAQGQRTVEDINRHGIPVEEVPKEQFTLDKGDVDELPAGALEAIEQDFWQSRASLQLIYQAALARMASPWAVLGCCAARILCLTPPALTLPAIIGGAGSLNWYAAIAAKSGGGKGAAMAVANRLVDAEITVRGIGSGEGMIEAYRRSAKDPEDYEESVLFSIDEIDSLGAMGGRSGQTTMAIVRQGFSGEKLGYSYRGRQSEIVSAHTYRMCIVASVQPERAGVLFDDTGGGTPQRFMWFPGRDKRITAQPPDWPGAVLPQISRRDLGAGAITVPPIVVTTIREARAASMSGDDNALDSHALYCREKFAYSLAYMDGRTEINEDDWHLSGIAAAVSDWCRSKVQDGYLVGKHRQSRERGSLRAIENDERDIIERSEYQEHVSRIAHLIVVHLKECGPMTPGALKKKQNKRNKPRFDNALKLLSEACSITLKDGKWTIV